MRFYFSEDRAVSWPWSAAVLDTFLMLVDGLFSGSLDGDEWI